ncbi:heme ABC transporter permease [Litoreibacter sp.]|nr:heme ABC transporter permease [Litoreibacter sp.]
MSIWKYANPAQFMRVSDWLLPVFSVAAALFVATGLIWGFFFTPDDFRQGSTVKIIYLHVPAALMAINAWLMMLVASLIWLIRRHHVSALAAKAAAPIGLVMTIIALLTGAIWGQPMWGTYWAWDPRLTSFLILFLFYLGYIALWQAIETQDVAADLTSILCLVGSVFALLSRYAVNFWNQGLHQGTSVPVATGGRTVSDVFFVPLVISMIGFILLFIALLLLRTRTEIRARRLKALLAREAADDDSNVNATGVHAHANSHSAMAASQGTDAPPKETDQ